MSIVVILLFILACCVALALLNGTLSRLAPLKAELERTYRDLRARQRAAADLLPTLTETIVKGGEHDDRYAAQYMRLLERGCQEGLSGGDLAIALGTAHSPRTSGLAASDRIVALYVDYDKQICNRAEAYNAALSNCRAFITHSWLSLLSMDFFDLDPDLVLEESEMRTLPPSMLKSQVPEIRDSLGDSGSKGSPRK